MPTACDALTAHFRPCRGYASHTQDGANLCELHRGWYHNFKWYETVAAAFRPRQRGYMPPESMTWVQNVLKNPALKQIPPEIIADRVDETNNMYFVNEFLRAGLIRPETSWPLWEAGLLWQFRLAVERIQSGAGADFLAQYIRLSILQPYFMRWTEDTIIFGKTISLLFHLRKWSERKDILAPLLGQCIEHICFGDPENRPQNICFMDMDRLFTIWRTRYSQKWPDDAPTYLYLLDSIQATMASCAVRMRQSIRDGLVFKEELMAAAWHPDRIQRALAAGGIEALDSL